MIHDCCGGQVECSINMWLPGNCKYFSLILVAFPLKNRIKSWWFYVWRHTIMLQYTTSEGFILSTSFRRTTRISRWETTQSNLSQFSSLCSLFSPPPPWKSIVIHPWSGLDEKQMITGEVMRRDDVYREPQQNLSERWESGVKSWHILPDVVRAGCLQASC